MSQRNLHKFTRFGAVPGDLSRRTKIRMLETSTPFNVFPWQRISQKCLKEYQGDHARKANRRGRQLAKRQDCYEVVGE